MDVQNNLSFPRSTTTMAAALRYSIFLLLFFFFKTLAADPISSFYFNKFGANLSSGSLIALYGDSKVVNGSSSVQITGPSFFSSGRLIYEKPIKIVEGMPPKTVSFSTYFSFSMSPESGDGLAFVLFPVGFPFKLFDNGSFGLLGERKFKVLSVEFDSLMDPKYADMNANHVGIDVASFLSVKGKNVSDINLVLNSGEKLQAWIDYEAGWRRLEVRLSKFGDRKPDDPLLFNLIDLSKIWSEQEVFVGLSSSNGNSSQVCNVYSWSFEVKPLTNWMHSEPIDPKTLKKNDSNAQVDEIVASPKRSSDCVLKILGALMLGTGCGALATFMVLLASTVFRNRRPVMPEEFDVNPLEYQHTKLKVVLDKVDNEKQ